MSDINEIEMQNNTKLNTILNRIRHHNKALIKLENIDEYRHYKDMYTNKDYIIFFSVIHQDYEQVKYIINNYNLHDNTIIKLYEEDLSNEIYKLLYDKYGPYVMDNFGVIPLITFMLKDKVNKEMIKLTIIQPLKEILYFGIPLLELREKDRKISRKTIIKRNPEFKEYIESLLIGE